MRIARRSLALGFASIAFLPGTTTRADPTLTTVATFTGTNGANLQAGGTFDSHGNFFGVTVGGTGSTSNGTIFEIAAGSSTITTVATFNGTNGVNPYGKLTFDSAGNMYGTTYGPNGGTVFEVASGSSTITTVAQLGGSSGSYPFSGVTIDAQGNLYGTTYVGGSANDGTVFEIASGSHTATTIATFTGTNGVNPYGDLTLDSAGNLYGTTIGGGGFNDGTIFKIAANTHAFSTVYNFNSSGYYPYGAVTIDAQGNLYGTASSGGTGGSGTVYEYVASTHTYVTLANFNGSNGSNPLSGLTMDGLGNLFGTTRNGGLYGYGTVFEIAAGTHAFTSLFSLAYNNGTNPYGALALDPQFNLYGTTIQGGAYDYGTVFRISGAAVPLPASLLMLSQAALAVAGGLVARRRRPR